jgi:hypothetical protein
MIDYRDRIKLAGMGGNPTDELDLKIEELLKAQEEIVIAPHESFGEEFFLERSKNA